MSRSLTRGALVGLGVLLLLSVGRAVAIAPTVAQVCEGLPGYVVLPPPGKAGGWWFVSMTPAGPRRPGGFLPEREAPRSD